MGGVRGEGLIMSVEDDEFDGEDEAIEDEWEEFRDDDGEPISLAQLSHLNLI